MKREYELRNGLSGTKVTLAILPIVSALPREQPTSGLQGAWDLEPALQGQGQAAKNRGTLVAASDTNTSSLQDV